MTFLVFSIKRVLIGIQTSSDLFQPVFRLRSRRRTNRTRTRTKKATDLTRTAMTTKALALQMLRMELSDHMFMFRLQTQNTLGCSRVCADVADDDACALWSVRFDRWGVSPSSSRQGTCPSATESTPAAQSGASPVRSLPIGSASWAAQTLVQGQ